MTGFWKPLTYIWIHIHDKYTCSVIGKRALTSFRWNPVEISDKLATIQFNILKAPYIRIKELRLYRALYYFASLLSGRWRYTIHRISATHECLGFSLERWVLSLRVGCVNSPPHGQEAGSRNLLIVFHLVSALRRNLHTLRMQEILYPKHLYIDLPLLGKAQDRSNIFRG